MPISGSGAAVIRLGVLTLMAAAAASVWELLALQAPGTPLYIAMLPGPIAALRELSTTVGLLLLGAGFLMPWAAAERPPIGIVALLYAGTLFGIGAQTYGAVQGMHGVQLGDLRRDALPLFVLKQGGLGLLLCGLLEIGRRVLLRRPPAPGDPRFSMGGQGHHLGAARARITSHRQARQLDPDERGH